MSIWLPINSLPYTDLFVLFNFLNPLKINTYFFLKIITENLKRILKKKFMEKLLAKINVTCRNIVVKIVLLFKKKLLKKVIFETKLLKKFVLNTTLPKHFYSKLCCRKSFYIRQSSRKSFYLRWNYSKSFYFRQSCCWNTFYFK